MPYISTYGVNRYPLVVGGSVYRAIDQGWSEVFGAQNLYTNMVGYSKYLIGVQGNSLKLSFLFFVL